MAQFSTIIPFLLRWEAGLGADALSLPPEQLFERARKSGYGNDPADAGGPTLCGVTLATYRHYCATRGLPAPTVAALKAMPFAHWRDIAKSLFWDRWRADDIVSPPVAHILVDWVWASGAHGILIPQRLLGVKADGKVGPVTLAAVNAHDPRALFDRLRAEREAFIDRIVARRPVNAKFKRGWLNRLHAITFTGLH